MAEIETRITDRTLGVWRVELSGGNWFAHLFHYDGDRLRGRPSPRTTWSGSEAKYKPSLPRHIELAYRFRWYQGDGGEPPWAIWLMRPGTRDEQAIEKAREFHDRLMSLGVGGWELLRRDRMPAAFLAALRKMPGIGPARRGVQ